MINNYGHISFVRFLLPPEVEIPPYMLAKKRQGEIWNAVFNAVDNGSATFMGSGTEKPTLNIRRANKESFDINGYTDIVLRLHTDESIVFPRDNTKLLTFFISQFRSAERLYTHSDSTRKNSFKTDARQIIINAYERFDLTKIMSTVPQTNLRS